MVPDDLVNRLEGLMDQVIEALHYQLLIGAITLGKLIQMTWYHLVCFSGADLQKTRAKIAAKLNTIWGKLMILTNQIHGDETGGNDADDD